MFLGISSGLVFISYLAGGWPRPPSLPPHFLPLHLSASQRNWWRRKSFAKTNAGCRPLLGCPSAGCSFNLSQPRSPPVRELDISQRPGAPAGHRWCCCTAASLSLPASVLRLSLLILRGPFPLNFSPSSLPSPASKRSFVSVPPAASPFSEHERHQRRPFRKIP